MQHLPTAARAAFTRTELSASIAMLGVLLAVLAPAIGGPEDMAKSAKATAAVKEIAKACMAYTNEYGKFPPIAAAQDAGNVHASFGDPKEGKCKVNNEELFHVLRAISAKPNADHVLNKRQTRYIQAEKASDPKQPRDGFADGTEFPEAMRGRFFDPWGNQYCVVLELSGAKALNLGAFYKDLAEPKQAVRESTVAFSFGPDGKRGGKDFEGLLRKPNSEVKADDVLSW